MNGSGGRRKWSEELGNFLDAAWRVSVRGAPVVMLLADSAVGGVALRADDVVAELAPTYGFTAVARASQPRPHFHAATASAV